MALRWILDRPQYGPDGLVTLFRGDDFLLTGKIVNLIGSYHEPVDVSQYAVSGFFPSASGGPDILAPAVTGPCGAISVSLPAASTPFVQCFTGGEGPYVVAADSSGRLTTIPTSDQALAIVDRAFTT
jgi:hypothetical protein